MSDLSGRVIHDENNRGSADGLIGVLRSRPRSALSDFHGQPNGLSPFRIIKNNQGLSQGLIRAPGTGDYEANIARVLRTGVLEFDAIDFPGKSDP